MLLDILKAAGLGIIEGLTEYIPVSSTGHLLLLDHFFGFSDEEFGKTFAVLIQLGAIIALLAIYFTKLWNIATGVLSGDAKALRFAIGVLVAFLPAVIIGATFATYIKTVLFNPWIVCFSLIVGGAVLLWVESLDLRPRYRDATALTLPMYLVIGICQCMAMVPGVSRSGATIVSAMLLGADRRSAAEFSFYLAMPTMVAAFAYDLFKSGAHMSASNLLVVAIGFIMSFIAGWIVVKSFLGYVSGHGFDLFAWWRVIVGTLGLIGLALLG